jgi:GLPGLI family protein
VYIDRTKGIIYNQRSFFKDSKTKPCVVFEETGLIEWKFEDGVKKIGSFSANKATANFRGRKYVAWFTTEIPLSIGPWKFHGLPGAILEIKDEELGVQFLISLNEFITYRDNFNNEFIRSVKAKLPRDVSISEISIKETDRSIEREYK